MSDPKRRIGETVFDRVGDTLIWCAADLWAIAKQVDTSAEVASDVTQSQKETEALNDEAFAQIEAQVAEIEQAIAKQVSALRALKEGQAAQVENRKKIEAMAGHLAESDLSRVQDKVATVATILGHGNYMHLIKGEVPLWKWLLRVVDPAVFASGFGEQEGERQRALFNSLGTVVNKLQRTDEGLLEEPE